MTAGRSDLWGYLRDRPRFLQTERPLLSDIRLLSRSSRRALPGPSSDHGGHLPLEPRAADHESAVGAIAQAPQQFGTEHVLEQPTIRGETRLVGARQFPVECVWRHQGVRAAQRVGPVAGPRILPPARVPSTLGPGSAQRSAGRRGGRRRSRSATSGTGLRTSRRCVGKCGRRAAHTAVRGASSPPPRRCPAPRSSAGGYGWSSARRTWTPPSSTAPRASASGSGRATIKAASPTRYWCRVPQLRLRARHRQARDRRLGVALLSCPRL